MLQIFYSEILQNKGHLASGHPFTPLPPFNSDDPNDFAKSQKIGLVFKTNCEVLALTSSSTFGKYCLFGLKSLFGDSVLIYNDCSF